MGDVEPVSVGAFFLMHMHIFFLPSSFFLSLLQDSFPSRSILHQRRMNLIKKNTVVAGMSLRPGFFFLVFPDAVSRSGRGVVERDVNPKSEQNQRKRR